MNLRSKMPETAKFIDELREVFGEKEINEQIRRGMKGEPTFYAKENWIEIGTRENRKAADYPAAK